MDLDDIDASLGGGSLPEQYGPVTREPVATFSTPAVTHPDEWWRPWGGELDSRAPSLHSTGGQGDAETG